MKRDSRSVLTACLRAFPAPLGCGEKLWAPFGSCSMVESLLAVSPRRRPAERHGTAKRVKTLRVPCHYSRVFKLPLELVHFNEECTRANHARAIGKQRRAVATDGYHYSPLSSFLSSPLLQLDARYFRCLDCGQFDPASGPYIILLFPLKSAGALLNEAREPWTAPLGFRATSYM